MTYPLKYRERVLEAKEEGLSYAETAEQYRVSISTIQRWEKEPKPQEKRNKPATKIDMQALENDVKKYPDAYQKERAKRFGVSPAGIGHALKRLKITRKKNAAASASRRESAK